mmetsp:Transcript_14114/g.40164  ORF Transcript_14114/g.40164 Transcript_14114/m.40164 type:complete len:205 (-) Transcript_14114:452-1066(-)
MTLLLPVAPKLVSMTPLSAGELTWSSPTGATSEEAAKFTIFMKDLPRIMYCTRARFPDTMTTMASCHSLQEPLLIRTTSPMARERHQASWPSANPPTPAPAWSTPSASSPWQDLSSPLLLDNEIPSPSPSDDSSRAVWRPSWRKGMSSGSESDEISATACWSTETLLRICCHRLSRAASSLKLRPAELPPSLDKPGRRRALNDS